MHTLNRLRTPFVSLTLLALSAIPAAHADTLDATAGGTFTFSLDRNALAPYVFGSYYGNNGYYLGGFWDSAASDYTNPANAASYFSANVGSTELSALNLVHDLTATGANPSGQPAGRHVIGTTAGFSLDSGTLAGVQISSMSTAGVVGEKLGMTGVQGFWLPNYNGGSRIINGDFSLQYDAARQTNGRSGWFLANNISYTMAVYDLASLNLTHASGDTINWRLTGDLLMAPENAGMILGSSYSDVGNFSLGVGSYAAPVPVPAAAWLFGSSLIGLLGAARRKAGATQRNGDHG
ncbi:hypothetical protein [Methylomagnum sp.]